MIFTPTKTEFLFLFETLAFFILNFLAVQRNSDFYQYYFFTVLYHNSVIFFGAQPNTFKKRNERNSEKFILQYIILYPFNVLFTLLM